MQLAFCTNSNTRYTHNWWLSALITDVNFIWFYIFMQQLSGFWCVPLVCFKIKFVYFQSLIFVDNENSGLEKLSLISNNWEDFFWVVGHSEFFVLSLPVFLASTSISTVASPWYNAKQNEIMQEYFPWKITPALVEHEG